MSRKGAQFWFDKVRAVVSKRGVDDGNQKGGGSLQPAQESQINYIIKKGNVKKKNKKKINFWTCINFLLLLHISLLFLMIYRRFFDLIGLILTDLIKFFFNIS